MTPNLVMTFDQLSVTVIAPGSGSTAPIRGWERLLRPMHDINQPRKRTIKIAAIRCALC